MLEEMLFKASYSDADHALAVSLNTSFPTIKTTHFGRLHRADCHDDLFRPEQSACSYLRLQGLRKPITGTVARLRASVEQHK